MDSLILQSLGDLDPVLVGYLVAFGGAAIASFASASRARSIDDRDTRRGLVALLVASGAWAAAHVGFLAAPTEGLATAFYVGGLIVGLAAIGPWLYFCSAYTGRTYHRNRRYRRIAVVVFLAIVAVKLTNGVHHLYFTTEFVTTPFPHTTVHNGIVHWVVMGLSYALAVVGYFMLFELFSQVSYRTRSLGVLVGLSGLPIVLDVVGFASPVLIDITYEPIGVAAFAIGVLFVYLDRFQAIRVAGERDVPIVVLDEVGRIREYNESARQLFPHHFTSDAIGAPLDAVAPELVDRIESDSGILTVDGDDGTRYYRVSESPFTAGETRLGRILTLTDVTHREQYRRELERQNDRLEEFASMVSHDLRNPLTVAKGQVEVARTEYDDETLVEAAAALDRMENLIDDLLALARQGQSIDELERVSFELVVRRAWNMIGADDATIEIDGDFEFLADADRVQQLFENLFRNAVEHGGSSVTIRTGALDDAGFYVADDGAGIPETDRDRVMESGYTTNEDGTGFGLTIVADIAEAHGWDVSVTESRGGGARFDVRAVDIV
jgi:signal transduction histidine kinase